MRPRRMKLGTQVDNGWMYQTAAYLSIYFFIFLSVQFPSIKKGWNLLHTWTMDGCIVYTRIRLLLLICFFISLSLQFPNIKNFIALLSGIVSARNLNLVHTWTMGGCIVYNAIKLLLLIISFFIFLSLQFLMIKIFHHTFLRNCEA